MGQAFSLPRLLGLPDAALSLFETDLLLCIVRMLICDEPEAVGRLICCCRTLAQLAGAGTEEGAELRKARRVVARQRLFDLRVLAGRQPAALAPLVTQISQQLSFRALHPQVDEPHELDLARWHRAQRPEMDAEWTARGEAVKEVLYANQSLVSIDLSVCYLTHMDATEIAKGLKVNKSLTTLNASGNFFGGMSIRYGITVRAPEGVGAIADALAVSPLTSLSLAENRLGPEGIRMLAPGLASTCLTSLDLSRNGMGAEGAAELAAGLASNSSLLRLDVRLNKLGAEGAKALAPGVAASGSLATLDVRFNGLGDGDEGEAALEEAVRGRGAFRLMLDARET